MADVPLTDELPRDFGKYRLEKRIATGGMAEVFLAHRLDDPLQPIVIKRILPNLLESGDFVQMFLDEARIAAQLAHPNVVGILDIGQVDGSYFLAMEYVHGEDIRRIYNRAYKLQRSLPLSHSIRVVADAALGLGHAHELTDLAGEPLGLVHRDVSPQNILVTYEGEAKVVDFGIAKAANKVAETRAGVLKGKYSYMSPEQALGEGIDHRTDIFALGIILYETTTGTRLFKRENELATLQAIIKGVFVPPSEALQNYPPDLERILLRALAKKKEDRYASAEDFSAALYDFLYDSGLYVERETIAGFMRDLFRDQLEEEQRTGEPALPSEREVREELKEAATSAQRPPPTTHDPGPPAALTEGLGSALPNFESPAGLAAYTESESDVEDLEAAARAAGFTDPAEPGDIDATAQGGYRSGVGLPVPSEAPQTAPPGAAPEPARPSASEERRKSTYVVRRTPDTRTPDTVLKPGPEPRAPSEPDEAPTVAVPSYRPGGPGGGAPADEAGTEHVASARPSAAPAARAKRAYGRGEGTERELAPRPASPDGPWFTRRAALYAAAAAVTVLVAVLTGVLVSRWMGAGAPERPVPEAPASGVVTARVTMLTEPGAEVFVAGEPVGTADAEGAAGPFDVPPGELLLRVSHPGLGFERARNLAVEAGQNYQVEIQGRHGWLRLAVAPWARVTIDGKEMGLTPLPKLTLLEGVHEVLLVNPDIGRQYKGVVRVLAGKEAALKVDLQSSGERL